MRTLVKNNSIEAFRILLKKLNVKFTNATLTLLKDHPEFPSLISFNHALNSLGMENVAIRTTYEQLQNELPKPLLVHLLANGGMYLVVDSVENDQVRFINENGATEVFLKDEFLQSWSEVALLIEKKENVQEKGFRINRVKDFFSNHKYSFCITSVLLTMFYSVFYLQPTSLFSFGFLLTKTVGLVISVLLMIQFFDKNNPFIQRMCGAKNSKANCLNILNSPAAYLFGFVSWGEVGLLYFLSFFFFLLFSNVADCLLITSCAAIVVAPYTTYSIYYQWRIAKTWCKLCLLVQLVLFSELLLAVAYIRYAADLSTTIQGIFQLAVIALVTTSAYSLLKPILVQWQAYKTQFSNLNRIKFNRDVFSQLLGKSRLFDLSGVSPIIFGNANATNRITVITNPTCPPCKEMNKELFGLLKSKETVSIEEIFLTESNPADPSYKLAEFMLKLHATTDEPKVRDQAFSEFYLAEGVSNAEWSQTHTNSKMESLYMSERLGAHHKWCIEMGFYSAPVVLLNQRFLPEGYSVNDLRYLVD